MIPEHLSALENMLSTQRYLQEQVYRFGDLDRLSDEERMEWIRNNVLALEDELHEALAETGWKPWASSNHLSTDAFKSELVDAWHFFMNLMLIAGMNGEDLMTGYFAKAQKNIERQQQGYDGVEGKCFVCHRALDDDAVTCTETWCDAYRVKVGHEL